MSKWCIFSLSTVSHIQLDKVQAQALSHSKFVFKFKFEDVSPVFSKLFILTDSSAIPKWNEALHCDTFHWMQVELQSEFFCCFPDLIVSSSEHLIPKLSDYQILAAKVQAVFILELCLTKDLFWTVCCKWCILLLSFQLLAFHWIQVSPQFRIGFMLSKSACY